MNSTKNVINHITCQNFNKSYESKLEDFYWLFVKVYVLKKDPNAWHSVPKLYFYG